MIPHHLCPLMLRLSRSLPSVPTAVLGFLAGCSGETVRPQPSPGSPGLHVVSGAGVTDTIQALLPLPLVVELRDGDGRPLSGEPLVFSVRPTAGYPPRHNAELVGGTAGSSPWSIYAATDANGRAEVRLRLGTVPGLAAVEARAPGPNVRVIATYSVEVGAPARVRMAPRDTAVFSGAAVQLRASVADRAGNPLPDDVSYEALEGPGSVTGSTGVVSTSEYGTVVVVARVGTVTDTVRIGSLPRGALVGRAAEGLVAVNLDGSGRRIIGPGGGGPSWAPDGGRVVLISIEGQLVTQPLAGGEPSPLLVNDTTRATPHAPRYSRDGRWVYFFTVADERPHDIWRVAADGTGLERLSPRPVVRFEAHPSPSPDGTRLALSFGGAYGEHIGIRDLHAGAPSDLGVGRSPVWSPTGEWIAFNEYHDTTVAGAVFVVRPDGSGRRRLTPSGPFYFPGLDWSTDGRWILAAHHSGPHLIEAETGTVIPLLFLGRLVSVSWRPTGPLP
jgi:hypothetical protein